MIKKATSLISLFYFILFLFPHSFLSVSASLLHFQTIKNTLFLFLTVIQPLMASSSLFSSLRSRSKSLLSSLKLNLKTSHSCSQNPIRNSINSKPVSNGFYYHRHQANRSSFLFSWPSSLLPLALAVSAGSLSLCDSSEIDSSRWASLLFSCSKMSEKFSRHWKRLSFCVEQLHLLSVSVKMWFWPCLFVWSWVVILHFGYQSFELWGQR